MRGTSNTNARGSNKDRAARKQWLLNTFGDGVSAPCAFQCGTYVGFSDISVDRYPIAGCDGGTYRHDNIRPACGPCNSKHGGALRSAGKSSK